MIKEIAKVTDDFEPNGVAELTAKIISAYVSNNTIAASQLAGLITTVAGQLSRVDAGPEPEPEARPEPAVSVRRSVRPDHLVCLVCGQPQKMLKRHLAVRHDLTRAQYRERFELKRDYPMTSPNHAQQRREVALRTGLGRPKELPAARRGRRSAARPKKAEPAASATA